MINGIDVSNITFDKNGEFLGLSDDVLASINAGVMVDLGLNHIVLNYACPSRPRQDK
jgi:hypothetical protein